LSDHGKDANRDYMPVISKIVTPEKCNCQDLQEKKRQQSLIQKQVYTEVYCHRDEICSFIVLKKEKQIKTVLTVHVDSDGRCDRVGDVVVDGDTRKYSHEVMAL
jgi:hypothetical protein